ncbi:MAG: ferredoxin, partial [bacterium]|nr:ferredoxin [bacterium]
VRDARRSILEYLLINHPIDCPICDKAGECLLQDYYMDHGLYTSRYLGDRWKKRKVFVLGPTIVMDEERCVLCSRCVRFFEEVSKVRRLGIFDRGAESVLSTYPGETLEDPYCGNIVDLCPVGALTDRDFRFEQRVWFLKQGASVCPFCARGCNLIIDYNADPIIQLNEKRVYRFRPRPNPEVNDYWICDMGRYAYKALDAAARLTEPLLREGKRLTAVAWDTVLKRAALRIKEVLNQEGPRGIGLIIYPSVTCETATVAYKLFVEQLGVENVALGFPVDPSEYEDDVLIRRDRFPNRQGLAAVFSSVPAAGGADGVLEAWQDGRIRLLYVMGDDLPALLKPRASSVIPTGDGILILQKSTAGAEDDHARMILPSVMFAEEKGSFINFEGKHQCFDAVLQPPGEALPGSEIIIRLAEVLGFSVAGGWQADKAPEERAPVKEDDRRP